MKIPEQPISALIRFGYNERESHFLYLVATFSGHFLRRHFTEFIGTAGPGWPEAEFLRKAIRLGHISETPYGQNNCRRFHLSARSIYEAIGKGNSSHRKPSGDTRAVLKMKILSFVLDNFNEDYLEEEADKTRFFAEQKSISRDLLPAKIYENQHGTATTVRYFVDKFPLFLSTESGAAPIPAFTFFEGEYPNFHDFPAHLNWYKPLLFALKGQYKLIYVGHAVTNFTRAEKQFEAVLSSPHRPFSPALLSYFRLKKLWQDKKYSQLTDQDLANFNRAEKRFSKPEHEKAYQEWVKGELPTISHADACEQHGTFETYLLNI